MPHPKEDFMGEIESPKYFSMSSLVFNFFPAAMLSSLCLKEQQTNLLTLAINSVSVLTAQIKPFELELLQALLSLATLRQCL